MTNFIPRLFFFVFAAQLLLHPILTLAFTIPYLKMYKVGRKHADSHLQYFLTRSRNTFLVYISSLLKFYSKPKRIHRLERERALLNR